LLSAGGLIGGLLGYKAVDMPLGRVERLALGLVLPWLVAFLVRVQQTQNLKPSLWHSYWSRLAVSYLWAFVAAGLAFFIVPFLLMILLDSGVI
jgi:hypothetical protein